MNELFDVFLRADANSGHAGPEQLLLVMLLSFCLAHLAAWVYMWTHTALSYSRLFVMSLVAIPPIVAMLVTLMSGHLIFAFGLLAVFAVVRFRNVLKDTRDTTFVLWCIVMGLACGTMRLSTCLLYTSDAADD